MWPRVCKGAPLNNIQVMLFDVAFGLCLNWGIVEKLAFNTFLLILNLVIRPRQTPKLGPNLKQNYILVKFIC